MVLSKTFEKPDDYFHRRLSEAGKPVKLVVVYDPQRFLENAFNGSFADLTGKKWHVLRYDSNDYEFRREYSLLPRADSKIVWITLPKSAQQEVNISYVVDVIADAELVLDVSLSTVLQRSAPETWPDPQQLSAFADEIKNNLEKFLQLHSELRARLPGGPLNLSHIKTIILGCHNPDLDVIDVVLRKTDTSETILRYLELVWGHPLDKSDLALLKEILFSLKQSDTGEMFDWISQEPFNVAVFLYLYDILDRYNVSNPMELLKGLELLRVDPQAFKNGRIKSILALVRTNKDSYATLIQAAESETNLAEVDRFINCISFETIDKIGEAIPKENSPLLLLGLCTHILRRAAQRKPMDLGDLKWADVIIHHPILKTTVKTKFSERAQRILLFFYELKQIATVSAIEMEAKNSITDLVNLYWDSRAFSLELNLAHAKRHLKAIEDVETQNAIENYLDSVKSQIYDTIELIDLNLAELIESDTQEFGRHPMISANIIRQNIADDTSSFNSDRRLWVLVFDGMRLDTWELVIKSIVAEKFKIQDEKRYVSPLPSYTDIARVSLLAGALPPQWRDYNNRPTSDHNILASRLFGLSRSEGFDRLRITVYSDTDFAQRRLNERFFDYNVLVYNVSDDLIHSHRGDIAELNDVIKNKITNNILPDLYSRISEQDVVLLTSDHGYQELEKNAGILLNEGFDENTKVSQRYLKNIECEKGVKISYGDTFYSVAKSRDWFKRKRAQFGRYAHGGISMNEMAVPAILLKKIVAPEIKGGIESPKEVKVDEDAPLEVSVVIKNEGNQKATFLLNVNANVGGAEPLREIIIPPNESVAQIIFSRPQATRDLKSLSLKLSYLDANGRKAERSTVVLITVKEKKDKVEISVGKELDSLFNS